MKTLTTALLLAFFVAPLFVAVVPASATPSHELQAAKRYCASKGRKIGIRPDGSIGCGAAMVAGPEEIVQFPPLKAKADKGRVSGIRFYYGKKAPKGSANTK